MEGEKSQELKCAIKKKKKFDAIRNSVYDRNVTFIAACSQVRLSYKQFGIDSIFVLL